MPLFDPRIFDTSVDQTWHWNPTLVGPWQFKFSNQTTPPPGNNQVLFNDADPVHVSRIWFSPDTTDGVDVYRLIMGLPVGTQLYLQDKNDHALFCKYLMTLAPVDQGSSLELTVSFLDQSGAGLLNNQAVIVMAAIPATSPDRPPEPEPIPIAPLVSFDTAKAHLRITDADHDDEIRVKLAQASAIIADYLKSRYDPAWDATSAPLPVQAATLKLLGSVYEHRGDDASTSDNHESAVWDEIGRILARARDPALA